VSYVGAPFHHDLFVSYSHGSDNSGVGFLQPWSIGFAKALENELRIDRRYRNDLSVFLDANHRPGVGVDPMAQLTPQLQKEIGGASLLVVLMSPDYVASDWCTKEREWWCERQRLLGLPTDERIAVVRIWPTPEPWPAALCDTKGVPLVGFMFHEDVSGVPRPLNYVDTPTSRSRFGLALLEIVGRITSKLDVMKERADGLRRARADADRLQQPAGQSIYLHGHVERKEAWERAALALSESGYSVVPGDPDPAAQTREDVIQLRTRRIEALAECDALLLLGTDDTRALDTDLVAVARQDRHSARARSQRPLPCGVLDTVGAPLATTVRLATARNVLADWIDGTRTPWTPQVQQWLTAKGAEAASLR
jgi:hypothetical protein